MVYLPIFTFGLCFFFDGKLIGKYAKRPMDAMTGKNPNQTGRFCQGNFGEPIFFLHRVDLTPTVCRHFFGRGSLNGTGLISRGSKLDGNVW